MMGQLDVLPVQQQWAERDKRKKKDAAQVSHHDQSNQRGTTDPLAATSGTGFCRKSSHPPCWTVSDCFCSFQLIFDP